MNVGGVFIALGTETHKYPGEALLWSTRAHCGSGKRVAVDLGRTKDMGQRVGADAPDLLILTHDDGDHIGGWTGFESGGLAQLTELWVPYEWGVLAAVLADGLDAPNGPQETEVVTLEESADQVVDPGDDEVEDQLTTDTLRKACDRSRRLEDEPERLRSLGRLLSRSTADANDPKDWRGTPRQVATRAMVRASRICAILAASTAAGVRVRYFSVDHVNRGQRTDPWRRFPSQVPASIANAVEVYLRQRRPQGLAGLAYLLQLTIQNRRALCPVLWECPHVGPSVLVWSDSSGEWATGDRDFARFAAEIPLATTPHHGSTNASHDDAWTFLAPLLRRSKTVLVQAGGESAQKGVRPEYLSLPKARRACTRCRHLNPEASRAQAVTAHVVAGTAAVVYGGCAS